MKKKIISAIIILTILSGIGVIFYWKIKNSTPLNKITIGIESSLLSAPVWIAAEKGYFKKEHLDITCKEFDSGKLSFLNMLEKGEVAISTVAPTPLVFSSFDREDFSILASFVYSYDDLKVIARIDKGIKNAGDLKGKKIGSPFGTTGQFFTEAFLIQNEIPVSDVEMIDIAPSDLPNAIKNNLVDAIVIWEPHAYNAKQILQNNAIRIPTFDLYKETFNFVVMKDFYKTNPDILIKFLKAIDKAIIFINNNKNESQTIVSEKLNIDKKNLMELWDDFVFQIFLDQSLISILEDEARWVIRKKIKNSQSIPNYLNYIYSNALQKVKPKAVHIYSNNSDYQK